MKKIILTILLSAAINSLSAQDTSRLEVFISQWIEKPYRYGGTTDRGIDCSAFVQKLYETVYEISIPRTCYYQYQSSNRVNENDLKPGDILFFTSKTSPSGRHCGVYIGNDQFIHAANSRDGVKISCVDDELYKRIYIGAGRY